jgi:hypothetical protein
LVCIEPFVLKTPTYASGKEKDFSCCRLQWQLKSQFNLEEIMDSSVVIDAFNRDSYSVKIFNAKNGV